MSKTMANVLVHIVYSTKHREPLLHDDIRERLHSYIGGICRERNAPLLAVNSVADHIHLLLALPRDVAIMKLIMDIKIATSVWVKDCSDRYRNFHWQTGYGIFSVCPSQLEATKRYIEGQADHHRVATFQEEYRKILDGYGMSYDEKYLWD